jgi:hypothetical protein
VLIFVEFCLFYKIIIVGRREEEPPTHPPQ